MNYRNILFFVMVIGLPLVSGYYLGINHSSNQLESAANQIFSIAQHAYQTGCLEQRGTNCKGLSEVYRESFEQSMKGFDGKTN